MSKFQGRRSRAAILAAVISVALLTPALGDLSDYEFQLVESVAKVGDAVVAVRLVDKRTSKPVPDAVIYSTRIDMAPDGMPTMSSAIGSAPSDQPGVYCFKTKLTMEGGWRLSLVAKVQGETGTVEGKLVLQAKP